MKLLIALVFVLMFAHLADAEGARKVALSFSVSDQSKQLVSDSDGEVAANNTDCSLTCCLNGNCWCCAGAGNANPSREKNSNKALVDFTVYTRAADLQGTAGSTTSSDCSLTCCLNGNCWCCAGLKTDAAAVPADTNLYKEEDLTNRVKRLEEQSTNFEEMMNASPQFDSLSFASTVPENMASTMSSGGCCHCNDGSQHRVGGWCPWACAKCVVICGGNGGCSCGTCK